MVSRRRWTEEDVWSRVGDYCLGNFGTITFGAKQGRDDDRTLDLLESNDGNRYRRRLSFISGDHF